MSSDVARYPTEEALVAATGDRLVEAIGEAVRARGIAHIVLTGGGTGIRVLAHVATRADAVDWSAVHLYWGDERYVAAADDDRNEKQAREALLDHVDIPAPNIHPMPAADGDYGDDLKAAAWSYERQLAKFSGSEDGLAPQFDVHLLGMGDDGHINSLFPGSAAVDEKQRWVLSVTDSPKPPPQRITLTLPTVGCARQVWLVVAGADKASAVAKALGGAAPSEIPAAGAAGSEATVWLLDEAAAEQL